MTEEVEEEEDVQLHYYSYSGTRNKRLQIFLVVVIVSILVYNFSDASVFESNVVDTLDESVVSTKSQVQANNTHNHNTNNKNKKKNQSVTTKEEEEINDKKKYYGVSLQPLIDYIDESASKMYPDEMPDHLWLLQEVPIDDNNSGGGSKDNNNTTTFEYVFLQSMNTYWKQAHSFRVRQNPLNYKLMEETLQLINDQKQQNQQQKQKTNSSPNYSLLYQRIHDAGGTLPFFVNWRIYYNASSSSTTTIPGQEEDSSSCDMNPNSFPIYQRATPTSCGNITDYWTIPTAPIWKQLDLVPKEQVGQWIVPEENKKQIQPGVVIAIPQEDPTLRPPNITTDLQEELKTVILQDSSQKSLAEKLVFLPEDDNEKSYADYTAVLALDRTSSLYPSLLCRSYVVLMQHYPQQPYQDVFRHTLVPWKHYIPIQSDWSDLSQQVDYVLDSQHSVQIQRISANAEEWCQQYMTATWMTERFVTNLITYVERLDYFDSTWPQVWKKISQDNNNTNSSSPLKGHWFRKPGGDSWTLPKSIVGEIKRSGLRADDPRVEEIWNQ